MKNLMKAIEVEEQYLKLLSDRKGKEKFNLKERLELYGYSLETFQKEKAKFLFSVPKTFKKAYFETLHDTEKAVMSNGDAVCLVVAPIKKWVCVGSGSTINDKEAEYVDIGHDCNSILSTPKDINPIFISKQTDTFELHLNWLRAELKAEGLKAGIVGVERNFGVYSIYYFHVYFDGEGREKLDKRWLQ